MSGKSIIFDVLLNIPMELNKSRLFHYSIIIIMSLFKATSKQQMTMNHDNLEELKQLVKISNNSLLD